MALQQDLPPEVLGRIFMYCLDGKSVLVQFRTAPFELPWVLSAVCLRWRSIACGHPQLWTNVWIGPWMRITHRKVLDVLSRSGNLCIALEGDWNIVQNLTPECSMRVQSLRVRYASITVLSWLSLFTNLEYLHLQISSYTNPPSPLSQPPVLTTLRALHLTNVSPGIIAPRELGLGTESPIWANLTDVSIMTGFRIYLEELWEILSRCHEIAKFKIRYEGEADWNGNPIILPKLRSFSVDPGPHTLGQLLNSLTLPSLTKLKIYGGDAFPWPQAEILDLIGRSQCRITSFYTGDNEVPWIQVLSLIRAMPDLVALHLNTMEFATHALFDEILAENLVPGLEYIYIAAVDSTRSVLKLLKSRWATGPGKGIRRGGIFFHNGTRDDVEENDALEELKSRVVEMGIERNLHLG